MYPLTKGCTSVSQFLELNTRSSPTIYLYDFLVPIFSLFFGSESTIWLKYQKLPKNLLFAFVFLRKLNSSRIHFNLLRKTKLIFCYFKLTLTSCIQITAPCLFLVLVLLSKTFLHYLERETIHVFYSFLNILNYFVKCRRFCRDWRYRTQCRCFRDWRQ